MLVVDFSQFLAGPMAAVRLADLGARVIKVERPGGGDAGRQVDFAGVRVGGGSLNFCALNRGKESFAADLKDPTDLDEVRALLRQADVLIHNFRPGVMERIGLSYEDLRSLNPRLIYACVSGYGEQGPWKDKPGQDLLAQARSGLPWLSGPRSGPPVAVGSSIADMVTSVHLAEGICALLYRRERTGSGGLLQTSLLESMIDLQVELFTAFLTEPSLRIERGPDGAAHPFISAPYGIYPTSDGYLALAMSPVHQLGTLLGIDELREYHDPARWWSERDRITAILNEHLQKRSTAHWLDLLEPADVWCASVMTLPELVESEAFSALGMSRPVALPRSEAEGSFTTTSSPLRIDGHRLANLAAAPSLGEHTDRIRNELIGD